jgi:hypothetical protein
MFEPSVLPDVAGRALLFVDTDHGFNLAFDPDNQGSVASVRSTSNSLGSNSLTSNHWHVVRFRGDALDLMAWQAHGKPAAYRYIFPGGVDEPDVRVVPFTIDPAAPLFIEAESLWPPIAQDQGYALASWPSASCASARRWLVVTPVSSDKPASITLALPAPFLAGRRVAPRVGFQGPGAAVVSLVMNGQSVHSARVHSTGNGENPSSALCVTLPAFVVSEAARTLSLTIVRDAGSAETVVAIDRIDIEELEKR